MRFLKSSAHLVFLALLCGSFYFRVSPAYSGSYWSYTPGPYYNFTPGPYYNPYNPPGPSFNYAPGPKRNYPGPYYPYDQPFYQYPAPYSYNPYPQPYHTGPPLGFYFGYPRFREHRFEHYGRRGREHFREHREGFRGEWHDRD